MLLYGHDTSPYVRRLRVLLRELAVPFHRDANNWAAPGLARVNPLLRVPVLHDEAKDQLLLDSRLAAAYLYDRCSVVPGPAAGALPLQRTLFREASRYDDENVLLAIDAAVDSAINVFLLERDGVVAGAAPYLGRQMARVRSCLTFVEERYGGRPTLGEGVLSFCDIALVCGLDWLRFRERYDIAAHAGLLAVQAAHGARASLAETHPALVADASMPSVAR